MLQTITGLTRDAVRAGLLTALRWRGVFTGRILDPGMIANPYPTYAWVREAGPVTGNDVSLVTARHGVANAILRHPGVATATAMRRAILARTPAWQRWLFGAPPRGELVEPIGPESMIGMDGADHARLRSLASPAFSTAAVAALRPRVEAIAAELLARARREPAFDLMDAFASALPVSVICHLLGVPDADAPRLRAWGSAIAADLDSLAPSRRQRAATAALAELHFFFGALIAQRRRDPRDDLLSRLVAAEAEEDRLTERELMGLCILLLFAGFETTVNLIGNGTMGLLQHQEQAALLREDPGRIPGAVEEMLRWDAPVQMVARVATMDVDAAGAHLPEGQVVSVFLGGANRDPEVFPAPDAFDVERPNARRHLAFAAGPHHCLGAGLARLESEVAFATLLDRLPQLRLAGPARRRPTFVLRGYAHVPLAS